MRAAQPAPALDERVIVPQASLPRAGATLRDGLLLVGLPMFILWIPVLFARRYPRWGYAGGWLCWQKRVNAFLLA
jgi:hypothetical protein